MRNKIKIVAFPVFSNYTIHMEITRDLIKAAQKYDATKDIDVGDDTKALCVHETNNGVSYMFLPHNATPGDIAHESWHVVKNMMEYVGVEIDSETVAYYLGYVVDEAYKLRRKK